MASRKARVLILCKTYPHPSAKFVETSCVAGLDEHGNFVRIFPVPFRLIDDAHKFKKWQWINARIEKASADHRPESHKIYVDTIDCSETPLPTNNHWAARRAVLKNIPVFSDFSTLEATRQSTGATIGLLKPETVISLDITPERSEWSEEERKKLEAHELQMGLFDKSDSKNKALLRKIPYSFHYNYTCKIGDETKVYRHKIADWEIGALYFNCVRKHGKNWEEGFRLKIERELPAADLHFLMGTIHRFPNQWMIISLIYPPHRPPILQTSLFD